MNVLPRFLTHDNPEHLYNNGRFLVLDLETDSEESGSALHDPNDIVLACWQVCEPDGTTIKKAHKWGGIYEQHELMEDLAGVEFVVAHHAKFELAWLKRCGVELRDVLPFCTMLGAWVLDGNQRKPRSLKGLARRYGLKGKLDIVSALIACGVPVRWIHSGWLLDYCHQDVQTAKEVFLEQRKELTDRKVWHLVHVRNMTCAVLADIEFEGLTLDPARVEVEFAKAATTKEELGIQLAELTGGINLASPKQKKEFLYNTLGFTKIKEKGKETDSTNANVLAKLKPTTERQIAFLTLYKDYNKASSLLTKNLEYFRLTCEQKGCKFYGSFRQNVVKTHRLASSGIPVLFEGLKVAKSVQLQNIPREFKRLFCSGEEDWEIAEFDGSQLEFRVAVDMGKDRVGLAEIEGGTDIHSFTAKVLTEAGEPTTRQEAKAKTFRPLYGGGSGTPALVAYCEYFKEKYQGISTTQRNWAMKCVDKKQFTTPYGMTFYFPDTKMDKRGYITNTTSIYNFPIQGFATGEIIPIALVYFWHRIRGKNIRIFATVHDSIATRVHKDSKQEALEIAKQSMTADVYEFLERVYNYKFHVPLGLGAKFASHWGDTKEEYKCDVWPDGRIEERS